jgi:Rrf2 family protein
MSSNSGDDGGSPASSRRSGFGITRAADYAVRALIHLATLGTGAVVSQQDIAAAIQVTPRFTGKVLQQLVAAGFVTSSRGKRGGFSLTVQGRGASMLDVIVAMDGPIAVNACVSEGTPCARTPSCTAHLVWRDAQARVLDTLRSARIESLAADTIRAARVADASVPHNA